MKAFLMAAGMGTRISSQTNKPKSLLNIGNGTLIAHSVSLLLKNHIDVNIILGYKGDMIKKELSSYPVTFFENPFYKETNSIASLWFAKDAISDEEDIILANADVFWQQDILDQLLARQEDVVLLGDRTRRLNGDYFFQCENERLIAYGKDMKEEDRTCEYVGIAKIRREFIPDMLSQLRMLVKEGDYNLWWENTLYSLSKAKDIHVIDIDGKFWSEIDVYEDYERILNYTAANSIK